MRREFSRKKTFLSFELVLKVLIFLSMLFFFVQSFVWGSKGFMYYDVLQKDIVTEEEKIKKLANKICDLKEEINAWKKNDFMVEKVARQDLQMAFPDEKIYVLK